MNEGNQELNNCEIEEEIPLRRSPQLLDALTPNPSWLGQTAQLQRGRPRMASDEGQCILKTYQDPHLIKGQQAQIQVQSQHLSSTTKRRSQYLKTRECRPCAFSSAEAASCCSSQSWRRVTFTSSPTSARRRHNLQGTASRFTIWSSSSSVEWVLDRKTSGV